MKPILGMFLVLACLPGAAWSADERAMAVVDKAIKAMGGQEKLEKAQTTYSTLSSKRFSGGKEVPGTTIVHLTIHGLEHRRQVTESERNGIMENHILIINGDQGWTQTTRGTSEVPAPNVALRRQTAMPELLAAQPNVLKSKGFDVEWVGEAIVGDRPAVFLKVTGQDANHLRIYYDKERGLPIKTEARVSLAKGDRTWELNFSDYRDFDGIKVATKVELKTDGARTGVTHITEFKILDKVPPDTFTEPK